MSESSEVSKIETDEAGSARPDRRRHVAMPGAMDPLERAGRARALPEYITRQQAADLAAVDVRAIDRWRRWHEATNGAAGLKTHFEDRDAGDKNAPIVRIAKAELLERIRFDPNAHPTPNTTVRCTRCDWTATVAPGEQLPVGCGSCGSPRLQVVG